jgi:hypothetical protein
MVRDLTAGTLTVNSTLVRLKQRGKGPKLSLTSRWPYPRLPSRSNF